MDIRIPDKLYFKIGEVAQRIGVKPHVLRYWESEFAPLNPGKSRARQRLYSEKDIELLLRVKDLLYHQGFTIAGAKKQLLCRDTTSNDLSGVLRELHRDLLRLRHSLDDPT